MSEIFSKSVTDLPEADIPINGLKSYLSQGADHQVVFMEFSETADIAEHSHESQWGIVVEGRIDLTIDGVKNIFRKGDRYFIPANVPHSAMIYAGYADITFFNQVSRYKKKSK